ncbi:hypothetical protein ACETRX_30830 [Labrys portucalensis]|uniref:GP-PDE domain-containing protein n=1 Tax=Labrys neptuniae TaxID=376174 RepID=A0ABV6ZPE6_9HYPH
MSIFGWVASAVSSVGNLVSKSIIEPTKKVLAGTIKAASNLISIPFVAGADLVNVASNLTIGNINASMNFLAGITSAVTDGAKRFFSGDYLNGIVDAVTQFLGSSSRLLYDLSNISGKFIGNLIGNLDKVIPGIKTPILGLLNASANISMYMTGIYQTIISECINIGNNSISFIAKESENVLGKGNLITLILDTISKASATVSSVSEAIIPVLGELVRSVIGRIPDAASDSLSSRVENVYALILPKTEENDSEIKVNVVVKNGTERPILAFAHQVLTADAAERAINDGANGIEIDLRYKNDEWVADHDNRPNGDSQRDPLEKILNKYLELAKTHNVNSIWFDVKELEDNTLTEIAAYKMKDLAKKLTEQGINVIYESYENSNNIAAKILFNDLSEREYVTAGWNDPADGIEFFEKMGISPEHRILVPGGTSGTMLLASNEHVKEAIALRQKGEVSAVFTWTIPDGYQDLAKERLDYGIDGLIYGNINLKDADYLYGQPGLTKDKCDPGEICEDVRELISHTPGARLAVNGEHLGNNSSTVMPQAEIVGPQKEWILGESQSQSLAKYDSDKNGFLDANDAKWYEIVIGYDQNNSGMIESNERYHLKDIGISRIILPSTTQFPN